MTTLTYNENFIDDSYKLKHVTNTTGWPRQLKIPTSTPELVSQINNLGFINQLVIDGDIAYVSGLDSGFHTIDIKNPNNVYSLIGTLSHANHVCFHDPTGAGYQFLTDQILTIDSFNAQLAARIITPLSQWKKIEPHRSSLMKSQLERIANSPNLSKNVFELVKKSLE